ncbi:acyl-CoA dehydrogenase family protein [Pseudomonas sp. NPDC007930]|uniref:acyl-CoA dehydrogenase family protein n=1 Tax=Pseudomonas sp. NPDC007930 TaxID=3364417 RepID=UPI0036ED8FD1
MTLLSPLPPPHALPGFDEQLAHLTAQLAASAAAVDRQAEFPHGNFALLQRHGLLGLTVPRALGGAGADLHSARKVIAAVARGEPSTALILVMQYLQHHRLQDDTRWPLHLRERLAREAVQQGALLNALRVEPELGSPARGGLPGTVARRTAEGWRLSGTKIYSTGSHGLTWLVVWARSDDAEPLVGGFLVHKCSPGVRIVDEWDHLGMRATCSHRVEFDDVLLPLDHAVSTAPANGPRPALEGDALLWMSVLLPTVYDAVARAARDWLVQFLHSRVPANLGVPLASLPRLQELLGQIDTLLFTNQALLDSAAAGQLPLANAGQLKQRVTAQAIAAVELAVQAAGNHGLSRRNPLERHYRDVLCGRVHTPQDDSVFAAAGRAALQPEAQP